MRHHREGPFWLNPNNGIIYDEDDLELNEYGETDADRMKRQTIGCPIPI